MTASEETVCPVCGGTQVAPARTANPYGRLVGCATCGHAFDPSASLVPDYDHRLQLEYFSEFFAVREGIFVSLYDRINVRRTVRALGLGRGQHVLEIGPGSGAVMAQLARSGHTVRGLDVSPAVAVQIDRKWGLPVLVEKLEDYARGACHAYDVVIMRHVLEHFADPFRALRDVHALLKPTGRLYVAVPNMASWHRMFRGWPGYEPYHLQYFDRRSLAHALVRAGFQIERITSYESLSGWVNTLTGTVFGRRIGTEMNGPCGRSWKRWSLETGRLTAGALLFPLRWLQSSLGRGEELVVLAEKVVP